VAFDDGHAGMFAGPPQVDGRAGYPAAS
jgi:hypothetical protein